MAVVLESSGLDEAFGGGADGRRWPYAAAQSPESSGDTWGFSGWFLEDRPTGLDGFLRYEANGMSGETQKCRLRLRLGVFQILGFR